MSKTIALIETHNLVKFYGDKVAVKDVSFEVRANEVFGFLGPNGAGKTTSIKMIVGLLLPTSGTVKVAGYDVQVQLLLATLLVIILVISAIVVDQYPCWIGVPNCD
jgi:ABC-2 type transport system ATP-binding protein